MTHLFNIELIHKILTETTEKENKKTKTCHKEVLQWLTKPTATFPIPCIKFIRPCAITVSKIKTLTCHISNNFNFMELIFQSMKL